MDMVIGVFKGAVAVVTIISFLLFLKNAFLMLKEVQPGTSWLRDLYGSSINVIFLKKFLTERGLEFRRRTILYCCLSFPLAAVLAYLDRLSRA